jgi:indole-3-glycerol phosphate synthase
MADCTEAVPPRFDRAGQSELLPDVTPRPGAGVGVLDEIVAHKREEVAARQRQKPLRDLKARVEALAPLAGFPFEAALRREKPVHLIAEIKPASPSAGVLQADLNLDALLAAYNQYASAISVLTDEKYFGGSFERLAEVSRQSPCPTLCKDFILEESQVYEARLAGAAAVLLIVKILDDATLRHLHDTIRRLGMTPVVEVQNEAELERALSVGARVLLINNRDLSTFEISLDTTHRLVRFLREKRSPDEFRDILVISASGIHQRAELDFLRPSAYCFLIGSSLMKHPVETLPAVLAELTKP